jgi:hypothetical protein
MRPATSASGAGAGRSPSLEGKAGGLLTGQLRRPPDCPSSESEGQSPPLHARATSAILEAAAQVRFQPRWRSQTGEPYPTVTVQPKSDLARLLRMATAR